MDKKRMTKMDIHVPKPLPIAFWEVVKACKEAKHGGTAVGVDKESWEEFDKKIGANLYCIWNRLASGTYFPQPVRLKIIPSNGKDRKLGIPALRDKIAQQVLKMRLEPKIEQIFSDSSYGYRPRRNCEQALRAVRSNCFAYNWVVDLDISKFFDEIDHEILMKWLGTVVEESWLLQYVRRVLEAPEQEPTGELRSRGGQGTPQGGVISPLLANLFLHYGIDSWLETSYPQCPFVRYADDMVIHCKSEQEAEEMMKLVEARLTSIKLRLNVTKSKIVQCQDWKRKPLAGKVATFDFLGYTFSPRPSQKGKEGTIYTVYTPEIKKGNQKKIRDSVKLSVNWLNTSQAIEQIALKLNHKIRGWITYFGYFGKRYLRKTMHYIDTKLLFWLMKKYKRKSKRKGIRKAVEQLNNLKKDNPKLFFHWEMRMT
jgi:group II intron reverse transcriptase/maturase